MTNTDKTVLLPCPFCGCTDISVDDNGHEEWMKCDWCGATGGVDPAPEFEGQSLEWHWNRRASRTQSPAEWHKRLHMTRKALERAEKFVADYEFDSDEGFHVPSDLERMLMLDMLNGLFDDEEFIAALDATPPAPERSKEEVLGTDDLPHAAQFLIERLDDFENGSLSDSIEDACRDFDGHVSPAIERLRSALESASLHKGEVEPVGIVVAEDDDLRVYWYEGSAVAEGDELYASPAPVPVTITDEMVERMAAKLRSSVFPEPLATNLSRELLTAALAKPGEQG